jgi:MerR family transcriptional regulator, heat shock protein HspR
MPRATRGVYGISVASELTGIEPQTLRLYERRGLLTPARTAGGTRRYSDDDLDRLRRITELVDAGINIAGISQILNLEHHNAELASDNNQLESENARLRSRAADRAAGEGRRRKDDWRPMTINPDENPLPDDVPIADAAEQQQLIEVSAERAGLDFHQLADVLGRDANPADIIDQAVIVPLSDDEHDPGITD